MKYVYFGLGLLVLLVIVGGVILLPQKLIITRIDCTNCDGNLMAKLQSFEGKSWRTVLTKTKSTLADDSEIRESSVKFKLPSTIDVYVINDQPVYSIHSTGLGVYYLINKDGQIIKIGEAANLPVIEYAGALPNVNGNIDPKLLFALDTISPIFYSYQIKSAVVVNDSLNVSLPDGITVIFPLSGDQKAILGAFKLIIDRLRAGDQNSTDKLDGVSIVDLRFKNPVLK